MMAMCGKTSLLLVVAAMLVQDAFPAPAKELAAKDPFENIPSELRQKISGWDPIKVDDKDVKDENDVKKLGTLGPNANDAKQLETLVLLGLKNVREANGIKTNLSTQENVQQWANYLSQSLVKIMANQPNQTFNSASEEDLSEGVFSEYVDFYTGEGKSTGAELPATDVVEEVVRKYNNMAQEKVNEDGEKLETIPGFNPDTTYVGLGISKAVVKGITYRSCVLVFGNEAAVVKFQEEGKAQAKKAKEQEEEAEKAKASAPPAA